MGIDSLWRAVFGDRRKLVIQVQCDRRRVTSKEAAAMVTGAIDRFATVVQKARDLGDRIHEVRDHKDV